ncbi:MAG: hypothetical protein ABI954_12690 [Pyrinomonadaceae bacterium]
MADIKSIGNGGLPSPNLNQAKPVEMPNATMKNAGQTESTINLPVGQPGETGQPNVLPQLPSEKIFSDAVTGRDRSQLDAADQLRSSAGISATDKLLGLHLQPTIAGALTAPPGNSEALRHLTPAMRRATMRGLLSKQRERTRRLAKFVRRERDQQNGEQEDTEQQQREESFISLLTEGGMELSPDQVNRATDELVTMARMLDLLDEMLNLQDYTFSQMGSFSQG